MNIGTFIACQNAMNTARNAMFSSMKGTSGSSSSKGDTSSSKTRHKIRNIIILFACFLFFAWCNFVAIYGLCQKRYYGFVDYSIEGTIIFATDVAYWIFIYASFKIFED